MATAAAAVIRNGLRILLASLGEPGDVEFVELLPI
jgi:hypothetical protein